ncbi:MAG: hypothetical protein F4179_06005, partial [Gammaproteobacteria bacterium]|nr:hypothetical protein [Gammaproteobacteria bacterium]
MQPGRLVAGKVLVGDTEHEAHSSPFLDVHAQPSRAGHGDHEPVLGVRLVEGWAAGQEGLSLVLVVEADGLRGDAGQLPQYSAQVGLGDRVPAAVATIDEAVGALAFARREKPPGGGHDACGDIQPPLPDVDDAGPEVWASRGHVRRRDVRSRACERLMARNPRSIKYKITTAGTNRTSPRDPVATVFRGAIPMFPTPISRSVRRAAAFAPCIPLALAACQAAPPAEEQSAEAPTAAETPAPEYTLGPENSHNRWSSTIPPQLTVPSGAVVEVFTKEASDGQITEATTAEDLANVDFDLIHALTGPIYVEGASPGDILAVTLHEIEVQGWGWAGIFPGFGFLAEEITGPWIRGFPMEPGATEVAFNDTLPIP